MNNVLNEASTNHRSWNNLSMQEKAAMIRVAVKNGLTDLKSIREKYNEFAEGGDINSFEEMNEFAGGGSKRRHESINNDATQQAMQYFMGKGLTDYQAAGLVGNLFRESRLIPTATNAGSGAYGIAQWLGDRKKNLFAKYGKNPTLNQQLDYVWHELGNTHRTGLKAIKSSKNAEEAARNAMGYYEFSAGPEAAIREMRKWGQDGEGAMQKGINFASQLIGGPVVPFRAETPQWNNIPFTPANPEVFFSNPVTTSQPVVGIEPTKTPVLEYDPKEVERQEKRDNLNRFNMFLGMLNGSNESTFPFSMFAEGGGIHIKPENRGKFTALKERTGHSATWFKEHGTPAQKKMAVFDLNSRHWKHGLGGNLFEDGGPKKPLTRDDLRRMLLNRRAEAEAAYNGSVTETQIIPNDNAWVDKPLTRRKKNPHSSRRAEEGAKAHAAWEREHPNLAAWGNLAGAIPFAVAAAPLGAGIVAGGDALAATTAGQAITSGLAPLYQAATGATIAGVPALAWADAGLTSAFGAHGVSQAVEEGGISPMTALEIAPLGRMVKPMYEEIVQPGMRLFNSPLTGNWTKIGNREYRLSPNGLGANGSPLEARSITPQITAENAARMTPEQWTAAQDAAIAKGDMAEAQRLRDLHFKVSAPNTKVVDGTGNPQLVIHKTPNDFTVFDNSRSIGNLNWAATPKAFEGENGVFATGAGTSPKEMRLYVNMKNPHYPTIDEGMEPAFINEGEDGILGIVDKDMTDFYRSASDAGEGFNMSLGVDNPYALKSAVAVTYDNNGVRIPLGERDNFKLNDIRYGLLPFGIGLTGYGLWNKNE